jgi:hypothetical protein
MTDPNDLIAKLNDIEKNGIGNWWDAKEIIVTIQAILADRDAAILDCDYWRKDYTELQERQVKLTAERDRLREALEMMVNGVQEWCEAIEKNGTSWDDWDEHYKNFAYRGGLDKAREALKALP